MSGFDPANRRKILLGDCGYDFSLSSDIGESKAVGGRGNSAGAFLGTAVQCLLVGFDKPAFRLLEKAQQWVTVAIVEREVPKRYLQYVQAEPFILDGAVAQYYETLALCKWLLHNEHDIESFRQFIEHEDRFLAKSPAGKDKVSVMLTLPAYLDAGAYKRALQLFASTPGLIAPKSLGSIRNEGQMTHALCRHRLGEEYAELEIASVVGNFLSRNLDSWLSNGHFVRAAEWMKIVYWHEGKAAISATDALLKCYEHLPNCSRPF